MSGQATAHYCDRCNVASFAHLLPLKVSIQTREQKLLEQRLGETAFFFVRSAHSCTGMELKHTDLMMNHFHDSAMSNGQLLKPCHVDFNAKDSYMLSIDVIVLMAFRQGITSFLSSVTSSKFFVIILTPSTC